jgi:hypothetical protein
MNDKAKTEAEERVANAIGQQLEHFRKMAPPCRGMERAYAGNQSDETSESYFPQIRR